MYAAVVEAMRLAYRECQRLGVARDVFAKGGIGELLLAHHLGHRLVEGGQGADASDPATERGFEYKVSAGGGFNFHFGARKSPEENDHLLRNKFEGLTGAYVAQHAGGVIQQVAFCDKDRLLEDLLAGTRRNTGGQLQRGYSIAQFTRLGRAVHTSPAPDHPYTQAVLALREMFAAAAAVGVSDKTFSKGGQGEVLLAHALKHQLVDGGAGADGRDASGGLHEYKVSITNQFNFHLGARKSEVENAALIERKFGRLRRVWVARRVNMEIDEHASCSGLQMACYLSAHFARTTGGQLNKNFSLVEFRRAFED